MITLGVSNAYACYIETLHILRSSTFDVQWIHTSSIFLLYLSYISVMIEVKKKKKFETV